MNGGSRSWFIWGTVLAVDVWQYRRTFGSTGGQSIWGEGVCQAHYQEGSVWTCGYYRQFVRDFGAMASPLMMMTRKSEPERVQWTPEREQAFHLLLECLCNLGTLIIPNVTDSFRLHTDASGAGLGAVLSVVRSEEELPVAFFSKQLQGAELRYSATELECLAVVVAIRHFEVYLAGQRFELVTDHQALKGLLSSSLNHNQRLTRWCLFLQDYDFVVTYKPGIENSNADGLSRQCWERSLEEDSTLSRGAFSQRGGDVVGPPQTDGKTRHASWELEL